MARSPPATTPASGSGRHRTCRSLLSLLRSARRRRPLRQPATHCARQRSYRPHQQPRAGGSDCSPCGLGQRALLLYWKARTEGLRNRPLPSRDQLALNHRLYGILRTDVHAGLAPAARLLVNLSPPIHQRKCTDGTHLDTGATARATVDVHPNCLLIHLPTPVSRLLLTLPIGRGAKRHLPI